MQKVGWLFIVVLAACGEVSSKDPDVTLTVAVTGTGSVTSQPPGIACPGTCTASFEAGAEVTLVAAAEASISFTGWSAGCPRNRGDCTLTLVERDTQVDASFATQGAKRWLTLAGSTDDRVFAGPVVVTGTSVVTGVWPNKSPMMIGNTTVTTPGFHLVNLDSATGESVWVKTLGDAIVQDLAVDADGNIIAAGSFTDVIDFGGGPLTPKGVFDGYVVKYRSDGEYVWAVQLGGTGFDMARAVAVDSEGDVYVGGGFQSTLDFGGGPLTALGDGDMFVARYRGASGAHVWARQFGNEPTVALGEQVFDLVVDREGGVGIVGTSTGKIFFDDIELARGDTSENGIFAKLDAGTGAVRFAKKLGGSGSDAATTIACDEDGSLYVAGRHIAPADLGGPPLLTSGSFVAKYTPAGAYVWSRAFPGELFSINVRTIAVDSRGDAVVAGDFDNTLDFGSGIVLASAGKSDAFVLKLDSDGTSKWAKRFGGAMGDASKAIALDDLDRIYMIGTFIGFVEFDGQTVSSLGQEDSFILSLEP